MLSAPAYLLQPGSRLLAECFGPLAVVVEYHDELELRAALAALPGSLAATVIAGGADDPEAGWLVDTLSVTAGRVTVGDWPTGVSWTRAQTHAAPAGDHRREGDLGGCRSPGPVVAPVT